MKLRLILLVLLTYCSNLLADPIKQKLSYEEQYQIALNLNKTGKYEDSARLLKSLMTANPEIERYKLDYIAVASNAKQCDQVMPYATRAFLSSAPEYVQDSIFTCALKTQPYKDIESIANFILEKRGKNQAIEISLIRLALDNKHEKAALEWSQRYIQDYPNDINGWLLRAQVLQDFNKPYQALLIYENLNLQHPNNGEIKNHIIQSLLDIGLPHLALEKIQTKKWSASQKQILRAMSDSGAIDIRWSNADSPLAPNRYVFADKAITQINDALEYAKLTNASNENLINLKADLLIAYQTRREWSKSIQIYESLLENGDVVPSYALLAVANSYSQIHQYSKAEIILQNLNQVDPNNPEVLYDLYYSQVEQDKFIEAKESLNDLIKILQGRPSYSPKLHINYSDALIEKAYWEAYQSRYSQAFERIDELMGIIPGSTDLLKAAGSVSQWQDNHEQSADYFRMASHQDPTDIDAKVGFANARLSSGDSVTFNNIVNTLTPDYADMNSVKKALERQKSYMGGYVTGEYEFGNGTYLGRTNNNNTADLRVYSSIFDDNYRGFARYRGLNSGPAISADVQGFGGGIQYKNYNQEAEVEIGNLGYSRLEGTQTIDDHWSINGSYERNAFYLFPGALYATTTGNVFGLNTNWKNNEITTGNIGYRYWILNNNIKQEIFGSLTQRLLTQYNYKLDLTGEIGNQQNTNSNVDYFSPINQTEYSGTLNLKVLQWRNTETKKFEFWHQFTGSYGLVTQSGFIPLPMNSYGYGQELKFGEDESLKWGVAKTSFPFNGQRTSYITGYLNFEMRFR